MTKPKTLRILVSGASGLVGSALTSFLKAAAHDVISLSHTQPTSAKNIFWNPLAGQIETCNLEGLDAVIHLAGENIASGRWTKARKKRLWDSRVQGTEVLVKALSGLAQPPKVFISASAIGYYGDRGREILDESSSKGTGFLADLCEAWEAAANKLTVSRVVIPRFGMILSPKGGALAKMLTPFRLGLGGNLGSGKQYYSWIAIDDVVKLLYHALNDDRLQGPYNFATPFPVTNAVFTRTLGHIFGRPTFFKVPACAVRLLFGEMGDALLLCSSRVVPNRLTELGLPFAYSKLEPCLRHLLENK